MPTLLVLVDGMGKDKYMKLLYVVDVCLEENIYSVSFEKKVKEFDPTCFATGLAL
jgi:hypothetical protein